MQELTHYINGAHVKGTSGRFADVYNPATGEVQAKVPWPMARAGSSRGPRRRRPARLGRRQSPAPRAGFDEIRGSFEPRYGQIGRGS